MNEYYFLFAISLIWIIFAMFQDLKTREVANWLNFSLIGVVLAYRAFYAVINDNYQFFFIGLMGIIGFFIIAQIFYYGRVFGGGDAKLLIGLGGVMPASNYIELAVYGSLFIIGLLFIGAFYSVIASGFIAFRNKRKFVDDFKREFNTYWKVFLLIIVVLGLIISFLSYSTNVKIVLLLFFLFLCLLFIYTKSIEKSCFIKRINAKDLKEGDWITGDVKVGNNLIKKNVHGLSNEEIKLLRKYGKRVEIKEGVPFVPAFLITFIVMLYVFSLNENLLQSVLEVFQ